MTQQNANSERQSGRDTASQTVPAFKPVALPALAAATRATQGRQGSPKAPEPPAILRKEAMLDK